MKKTYMIPTNKVVELGLEQSVLIVGSPDPDGDPVGLNMDEQLESSSALNKEFKNSWDNVW